MSNGENYHVSLDPLRADVGQVPTCQVQYSIRVERVAITFSPCKAVYFVGTSRKDRKHRYQIASGHTLGFDAYTLGGLLFGTEVDTPVQLTVTGTMDAELSFVGETSSALVWADLRHSDAPEWGNIKLFSFLLISYDSDPLAVRIDQVLSRTYRMTAGVPFGISYELLAKTGGIGAADFSSTGVLSFILPQGTDITSSAGFFQVAVPEPRTYVMLLTGLCLVAFVASRRKRKCLGTF